MIERKYVINLDRCLDRMESFDDSYTRWSATDYRDLQDKHPIFDRMISYHSIRNTNQHKAKCGCFLSHTNIWRYIVTNKLNNTLIVEDDAEQVNDYAEGGIGDLQLPTDSFTYLGGFFHNKKMTDNTKINIESKEGINLLDKEKYRILMTLAYFIPTWEIAEKMLEAVNKDRVRAIDVMMYNIDLPIYYHYPAIYIEKDIPSTIRKGKTKHSNEYYQWV